MKKRLPLLATFILFQISIFAQFSDCYEPANWNILADNTGPNNLTPGVVFDANNTTMTITADGDFLGISGMTNPAGIPFDCSVTDGLVAACIDITADGNVTFDWNYTMQIFWESPGVEPFGYCLNGQNFSSLVAAGNWNTQTGTANIAVSAGDVLCIGIGSYFAEQFQAVTTVTNFSAPVCASNTVDGLIDCYDPVNWGTYTDNSSGSVTFTSSSITLVNDMDFGGTGLDVLNCSEPDGTESACILMPNSGDVTFNWTVFGGPFFNPLLERFGYCLNGVVTELTDVNPPPFGTTNGTVTISVQFDDELCFVYASKFADSFQALPVTIDNFSFPSCQDLLNWTLVQTDTIECAGDNSGGLELTVTSGPAPYSYTWNSPLISGTSASNLPPGNYCVTITDANGDTGEECISIDEPFFMLSENFINHIICNGGNEGQVSVNVTGGIPPFSYLWSNGDTTDTAMDLVAGDYTLTVTDGNGCTQTFHTPIAEPSPIVVSTNPISDVTCNGFSDGAAEVSYSGGIPGYVVTWEDGTNGDSNSNLPAGENGVTITDGNGCEIPTTVNIDEPVALGVTFETFATGGNGTITAHVTGGVTPYAYVWSNSTVTDSTSNTFPGGFDYTVTITDANGCTLIDDVYLDLYHNLNDPIFIQSLSLFPNPAKDQIQLSFSLSENKEVSVILYNSLGQSVLEIGRQNLLDFNQSLAIQGLSSGIYLLGIRLNEEVIYRKVLVE